MKEVDIHISLTQIIKHDDKNKNKKQKQTYTYTKKSEPTFKVNKTLVFIGVNTTHEVDDWLWQRDYPTLSVNSSEHCLGRFGICTTFDDTLDFFLNEDIMSLFMRAMKDWLSIVFERKQKCEEDSQKSLSVITNSKVLFIEK